MAKTPNNPPNAFSLGKPRVTQKMNKNQVLSIFFVWTFCCCMSSFYENWKETICHWMSFWSQNLLTMKRKVSQLFLIGNEICVAILMADFNALAIRAKVVFSSLVQMGADGFILMIMAFNTRAAY